MQGYCVKCRAKRDIKDAKSITMKNGRPATQGVCPTCGTKMFRIGKSQIYSLTAVIKGMDNPVTGIIHSLFHFYPELTNHHKQTKLEFKYVKLT